jgi:hypothetical protein
VQVIGTDPGSTGNVGRVTELLARTLGCCAI